MDRRENLLQASQNRSSFLYPDERGFGITSTLPEIVLQSEGNERIALTSPPWYLRAFRQSKQISSQEAGITTLDSYAFPRREESVKTVVITTMITNIVNSPGEKCPDRNRY